LFGMGMRERLRGFWWDLVDGLRVAQDARGWLARHSLPTDERTVAVVEERLASRRRGWVMEAFVYLVLVLTGWWLISRDQPDWGAGIVGYLWVPVIGAVTADIARRHVVWGRWDRRLLATMPVRVASLRAPTWDDLVGERAVRRAVVLLATGLLFATWVQERQGALAAWTTAFLTGAAVVHSVVLLELARRRPTPAGDEAALAVNDRLRGEEARQAVTVGLFWVVLAPAVAGGSNVTWTLVFFVGYLLVVRAMRQRYAYEQVDGELVAR
jgi:hypothetical protein